MSMILPPDPILEPPARADACEAAADDAFRELLERMIEAGWERREAAVALNALSWNYLLDAAVKR